MKSISHKLLLPLQVLSVLLFIFLYKLGGVLDISLVFGLLLLPFYLLKNKTLPKNIIFPIVLILGLAIYSFIISIIHGGQEVIWGLKFIKTCLLMTSSFIFVSVFFKKCERFNHIIIYAIAIHAFIVISLIIYPTLRDFVYPLTGYVRRGPEWSRSPGLTIAFNSTAIVHITALLMLLQTKFTRTKKSILFFIIFISLFFLGRSIVYIGIIYIIFKLLFKSKKSALITLSSVILVGILLHHIYKTPIKTTNTIMDQIHANIFHLSYPIFNRNSGVENYYRDGLHTHFYFSEKLTTLLFGESYSGHIGLMGGRGVTNSDVGLINAINAIGILGTTFTILIHLYFIINIQNKTSKKVLQLIVFLMLALSFKETGLFESNSSHLLFLIWSHSLLEKKQWLRSNFPLRIQNSNLPSTQIQNTSRGIFGTRS